MFYVLTLCYFVLVFFSLFSIAITSLGEERANLSACLVLLVSSSSWCLERAAVCDCGTPWTFLLLFFFINSTIISGNFNNKTPKSLLMLEVIKQIVESNFANITDMS